METVRRHGLTLRRLTEPDQLRALAHPRRMEIADLLLTEGPLTATQCADRLGDSAASCSYHLRQLARFGFVEEEPGGKGRQRPWRWVPMGNTAELGDTPAQRAASSLLVSVIDERNAAKVRGFRAHMDDEPWLELSDTSDWTVRLTADELRDLRDSLHALIAPYQQRTFDNAAPDGARVVDVLTYLLPRPARRTDA